MDARRVLTVGARGILDLGVDRFRTEAGSVQAFYIAFSKT